MANWIVRKGERKDVPAVMALVHELAAYEKALDQVELTAEQLEQDGFDEHPAFGLFVAETNGEIVGMALYYWKYSTWQGRCIYLEDLVVQEAWRNLGVGAGLFEAVAQLSKTEKVKRMEWQVLDWNEPALQFYKKHEAHLDGEWINGKLVYEQLQQF